MTLKFKKRTTIILVALALNLMGILSPLSQGDILDKGRTHSVVASNIDFESKKVIVGGRTVGVTISFGGALISGTSEIIAGDGKKYMPSRDAGLKAGDVITAINENKIGNVQDLIKQVSLLNGEEADITALRDNKTIKVRLTPRQSNEDNTYKIGAWVKDATSGVGTITYYDPENKSCGALGHGITDQETGKPIHFGGGEILSSTIVSIEKGSKGNPGELKGVFLEKSENLGQIMENTKSGLFGVLNGNATELVQGELLPIAKKDEINEGKCRILSNIEGDKIEEFEAEIQKVMKSGWESSKGMVIKITDEKLLSRTGGIVQGMSGSPIVQENRLIGAITHVFVNDPTRGYGIFIENMLNESDKLPAQ